MRVWTLEVCDAVLNRPLLGHLGEALAKLRGFVGLQLHHQAPATFQGTRMMRLRPSLVTSIGPSPVLGFMAAIYELLFVCTYGFHLIEH